MSTAGLRPGDRVMICWDNAPREFGTVVSTVVNTGLVRVAVGQGVPGEHVVQVAGFLVRPACVIDEVADLDRDEKP